MPRSAEERWKEIDDMRRRTDAMRAQNERDREELKKWEESIKDVPVPMRMAAAKAAKRSEKYTLEEFKTYLKSYLTKKNLTVALTFATPFIVYGIYLMFWKQAQLPDCADEPPTTFFDSFPSNPFGVQELDPNDPYAHCHATPEAACCANESVVETVFAKAEAKKKRRCAAEAQEPSQSCA